MTAIIDADGYPVVTYHYDPWGEILSISGSMATTLGVHNPLLYRGYVYDHETGLYYLQSRYYNPDLRRFINADAFASTGQGFIGYNMFAYCGNNPIMYRDDSGKMMVPAIAEMRDGVLPVNRTTDGKFDSDLLLDYVEDDFSDMSEMYPVHIDIQYVGTYEETEENVGVRLGIDGALLVAGVAEYYIPYVGPALGTATLVVSAALFISDVGDALNPGLPDGVTYRQYKATIIWDEEQHHSEGSASVHNHYEYYYLRNVTDPDNPSWDLQKIVPVS